MSGFCWWLANLLCRTLEPDEQEVVRGDLAEEGTTGGQALSDLLGLIRLRRLSGRQWDGSYAWESRFFFAVIGWPAAYLLATRFCYTLL